MRYKTLHNFTTKKGGKACIVLVPFTTHWKLSACFSGLVLRVCVCVCVCVCVLLLLLLLLYFRGFLLPFTNGIMLGHVGQFPRSENSAQTL